MTKSIIITYNEADENVLMVLFEKFKIKTKAVKDYGDNGVPQRVADDIVSGLENIKKYERGEIELTDAYDLLRELRVQSA